MWTNIHRTLKAQITYHNGSSYKNANNQWLINSTSLSVYLTDIIYKHNEFVVFTRERKERKEGKKGGNIKNISNKRVQTLCVFGGYYRR